MNPRIEPSLEPAAPALRIDPARRLGAPARFEQPAKPAGHPIGSMLFGLLLASLVLPPLAIVALRWLPPPTTSYMLQSPVKPVQYHWVPAAEIAEVARRAVVAAEDQKFWTHHGFDMEAIQKAEEYNRNARHHRRGASTISQQTAKNLFLWPGGYVRKGIEAGLTLLIEKIWGKPRILEMYLNVAEFGPGVYGVEAASRTYFGKPASQLNAEEAARLAAVLPNPRKWSVSKPGPYVQLRTAWILGQMGYGSRNAPREEPEPPASELPDAGDAVALPDDSAPAPQPPALLVSPAPDESGADAGADQAAPQALPHPGEESPAPPEHPQGPR